MQIIVASSSEGLLNKSNLDRIKQHILAQGRRCTYTNMFNNNPCFELADFQLYLHPDPGPKGEPQWNINCDVTRGDFNTLVIRGQHGSEGERRIDFQQENEIRVSAPDPVEGLSVEGLRALPEAVVLAMLALTPPPPHRDRAK